MNTILKVGLVLGVLVEIWTYLYVAAGWHRNPSTSNLFFVVIPIQLGVLIWGLRQTAAQGRGYGGQLVAGTLMSFVGSIVIVVGSYLCTAVVFPNYFTEMCAMQEQALRAAGRPEAEIRQIIDMAKTTQNPLTQSLIGLFATVVTGFVGSLIIAAFARAKKA